MFKRFPIRIKLTVAFLLAAILVGVAGYYEVQSLKVLNNNYLQASDNNLSRRDALNAMKSAMIGAQNDALVFSETAKDHPAVAQVTVAKNDINADSVAFDSALGTYRKLLSVGGAEHVPADTLTSLSSDAAAFFAAAQSLVAATGASPASSAKISAARADVGRTDTKLNTALDNLITAENNAVNAQKSQFSGTVAHLSQLILLLLGLVILAGAGLAAFAAVMLVRSLGRLRDSATRIANGDFSHRLPVSSNDEAGQASRAFNDMANRLSESYQRLAFETERDRTLLESLGEGVIAVDEHANIALINDKAVELLELLPANEMAGKEVGKAFDIYDAADKPVTPSRTPAVVSLKTLRSSGDVYGFHKKSGAKSLFALNANPVIVNDAIAGAIMTVRDVTKEKEIDRMKTEFISLASHQLRTPLSAIKWFTEMLLSGDAGKLKSDQLEFAKNIADSTERMIALVNALLNISRIESGRIMIDPKPTDLRELVAGIVNDLKAKTEEKRQTLLISVHDDLPKINLDPRLISQVYMNLLTNAIKYTPKGGEISVFISRKDGEIISQVTDNGYGIPKEQQDRIFQKFFRAANAVKVETDGTGLGLYLIKAVVESSGGKIWFESEEGKGTTFWFSIPLTGMKRKAGEVTLDS